MACKCGLCGDKSRALLPRIGACNRNNYINSDHSQQVSGLNPGRSGETTCATHLPSLSCPTMPRSQPSSNPQAGAQRNRGKPERTQPDRPSRCLLQDPVLPIRAPAPLHRLFPPAREGKEREGGGGREGGVSISQRPAPFPPGCSRPRAQQSGRRCRIARLLLGQASGKRGGPVWGPCPRRKSTGFFPPRPSRGGESQMKTPALTRPRCGRPCRRNARTIPGSHRAVGLLRKASFARCALKSARLPPRAAGGEAQSE